jgi:hypothetical protein
MKNIFKAAKVVLDVHEAEYVVYYKKWLFWRIDRSYAFWVQEPVSYRYTEEKAMELAIKRAQNLMESREVWHS